MTVLDDDGVGKGYELLKKNVLKFIHLVKVV